MSFVVCRASFVVRRLSFVVCRAPFVVCRASFVVCRASFVVCRLSFVSLSSLTFLLYLTFVFYHLSYLKPFFLFSFYCIAAVLEVSVQFAPSKRKDITKVLPEVDPVDKVPSVRELPKVIILAFVVV